MKTKELLVVIFWMLMGVYVSWASVRLGVGTLYYPGAGLMPFYLGLCLILLSLVLLFRLLLKRAKEGESAKPRSIRYAQIAILVGALVVYSMVIDRIGYIVATLILLAVLFWTAGTKKVFAVIASIVTVAITFYGFTYLGLRFPPGVLTILGF
jgi:putative tricarboxylic transport membrane protein